MKLSICSTSGNDNEFVLIPDFRKCRWSTRTKAGSPGYFILHILSYYRKHLPHCVWSSEQVPGCQGKHCPTEESHTVNSQNKLRKHHNVCKTVFLIIGTVEEFTCQLTLQQWLRSFCANVRRSTCTQPLRYQLRNSTAS